MNEHIAAAAAASLSKSKQNPLAVSSPAAPTPTSTEVKSLLHGRAIVPSPLPAASPQTSQFNRILDLVTEHEAHYREQDVKIAELFHKVSALQASERLSSGEDSAGNELSPSSTSKPSDDNANASSGILSLQLKEDLSGIKLALDKMNKTVLLLSQENEITRKRQTEFMDTVREQVRDISSTTQRDISETLAEVESLKRGQRDTYKHLKHQCKSFIVEKVGAEESQKGLSKMEDWVRNEISQMQTKIEAGSAAQFQKHKYEMDVFQDRLQSLCECKNDLKSKLEQLMEDRTNASKEIDKKLELLSKDALAAKETISKLAKREEFTCKEIGKTQKHLVERGRDLRHLAKKLGNFMQQQASQSALDERASDSLRSSHLYNSWRSTLFTYPNAAKAGAGKENANREAEELETYVRKLKQKLRQSEKDAARELGLLRIRRGENMVEGVVSSTTETSSDILALES